MEEYMAITKGAEIRHDGLPVLGYREQTQETVDLVNEGKAIEELAMRWIDKLNMASVQMPPVTDPRMIALGRTHIQTGFMWAARSVFQPGRLESLSNDDLLDFIKGKNDAGTDTASGGD
jgi:hypothetical protein